MSPDLSDLAVLSEDSKAYEDTEANEAAQDTRASYGWAMPKRRLLASGELADELGISRRSISRYAERGWITPDLVTPGGRYMWDLEDVREQLRTLRGSQH